MPQGRQPRVPMETAGRAGAALGMEEPGGGAEPRWLRAARAFVCETLCPARPGGGGGPEQLADSVLRCLRSTWGGRSGEFPLGYSFISISDLQCQQRTPCCSHMTWSTREFKEWAHQDEVILPKQSVLPRAHLILIGYLTNGRRQDGKEKLIDGNLYVQDNTGSVPCELLHFDFEWLELLFLFPSWAYIPHTSQSSAGYVEILADPVPVDLRPERVVNTIPVFYPATAAQLLSTRGEYKKRIKLNVAGELARLSTLLCIHHKTFFFLFLKCFSSVSCVPVLVQKPPQLAWHHMLQLGHGYVLTALSVSSLKASGRKVFVTSFSSCLLPYSAEQVKEQTLEIAWHGGPLQTVSPEASVQLSSPLELTDEKLPVLIKESKILSYMGTITRVLNAQAGLYELDNKVCLCLAYQQQLNSARGLRPGACVELQDVHLLQKPLASFPFVVILGACLHSTVVLKGFSRLSTFHQPVVSSRNLYMQLLFRFNLGLPLYLWLVSLLEMLEQRFCSFFGRRRLFICSGPQRPGIAEKFLVPILKAVVPSKERVRDVHREILADMHHCPLQQYQPLEPPCQAPPLSLLCSVAEQRSWEAFNPSQLLSHLEAQHMGTQELNRRLAWSYNAFSAESFQPRMVLLGVLRASSGSGSLQLQDKSDLLPCVISQRDGSPFTDTALIGSLLQVEAYQLVVERFLQSDFPSWEQLLTPEHVRGKETRLYVQFCFEDVQILHMPERHVQEGPTNSDSPLLGKKDGQCSEAELGSPEAKVPKLERTSPGAGTAECCDRGQSSARGTSCMSRLFLVTQKEGLMSRNYLPAAEGDGEGQDLQLSFQATVLWMSKPQLWRHPREIGNLPELEQTNKDSEAQERALLLFMGRSLRWFPFLHPDGLYRLIVPQCLDVGVFEQTGLSPLQGRLLNQSGCPSYLLVSDTWRLQHETWLTCLAQPQVMPESVCPIPASTVFSIPELLSNSFTGSLVSFSGAIVERTLCASPGNEKFSTPCDMRRQKGTLLCWDHSVKLSVSAAPGSSAVLDVYIAGAYLQHLWGLLPGAKILFQNLQRKISRFHNVYCTYIASSCISILALPPSCLLLSSSPAGTAFKSPAATSPTLVVLSKLLLQPHSLSQGQILCHLSCVLDLSMQWICSDCSSIFREGRCSRHSPPCPSHTGVSKAFARILVEDGTGEALVLCRNQQVAALLGLSPAEWNAVQSNVQSRGSILIQHGGASARPWCVEEPEDLVTCYLRNLCRSRAISQPMLLDFSLDRKPSKIPQLDSSQPRRFLSGEVEYISRVGARLNLMCLNIQEADPKVLCGLTSKRIKTWISHSA